LSKAKFAFEPLWSFKQQINVLAAKLAANYRYTLLIGPDNVTASFGVNHSVLEVQVNRHLKRKIIKFEINLIITTRWFQFDSKKSACNGRFHITRDCSAVARVRGENKVSKRGDFHY